jgi:hypothetical protein
MFYVQASLLLALLPQVLAIPAPAPAAHAEPPHPLITPKATLVDRTPTRVVQRGLTDFVGSILSDLGSGIPSYVASGVPDFFQGFPTGGDVLSSAGVSSSDLAAAPTMVLNLP